MSDDTTIDWPSGQEAGLQPQTFGGGGLLGLGSYPCVTYSHVKLEELGVHVDVGFGLEGVVFSPVGGVYAVL